MDKEDQPASHSGKVAQTVTTAAVSLTLLGCVDTTFQPVNPGQRPAPPTTPGNGGARPSVTYTDSQAFNKYFNNGYNYVDAKVLASYWGGSPSQAKVRLGHKMLSFGPSDGRYHVGQARGQATRGSFWNWPVSFTDGGYTYNDAVLLGNYWGGGPSNAKMKLARNLINGKDSWNRAALSAAR